MSKNKNNSEIVQVDGNTPVMPFSSTESFERALRMAKVLSASSLVPSSYQGEKGLPNCLIALEMAHRIGISPFLVMQNMHIIKGRPSWSSTYLIAAINSSGKFSPLRYRLTKAGTKQVGKGEVNNISCTAYATELATGEKLEGPEVTMEMAIKEGWYAKDGSKWQTMPELMIMYRSAAFFSRMYCPEVAMGLHSSEEVCDISDATPTPAQVSMDTKERAKNLTTVLLAEAEAPPTVVEAELLPPQDEPPTPEEKPVQKEEAMPRTRAKATQTKTESHLQRLFNFLKGADGLGLNNDQCKKFMSDALDRKIENSNDLTEYEINIIKIAANDALLQRKGAA